MKKIFYALLAAIAITSCSSDNDTLPTKPDEQSTEQPTKEPVVNPVENPTTPTVEAKGEFVLDNVTYKVSTGQVLSLAVPKNVTQTTISLTNSNDEGTKGVIVHLMITNESSKTNISGTYQLGDWRDEMGIGILDKGLTGYEIFVTSSDGKTLLEHYSNGLDRANLKEGVLTITENGNDNYTIKYNLLFENGMTSSANTTLNLLTRKM